MIIGGRVFLGLRVACRLFFAVALVSTPDTWTASAAANEPVSRDPSSHPDVERFSDHPVLLSCSRAESWQSGVQGSSFQFEIASIKLVDEEQGYYGERTAVIVCDEVFFVATVAVGGVLKSFLADNVIVDRARGEVPRWMCGFDGAVRSNPLRLENVGASRHGAVWLDIGGFLSSLDVQDVTERKSGELYGVRCNGEAGKFDVFVSANTPVEQVRRGTVIREIRIDVPFDKLAIAVRPIGRACQSGIRTVLLKSVRDITVGQGLSGTGSRSDLSDRIWRMGHSTSRTPRSVLEAIDQREGAAVTELTAVTDYLGAFSQSVSRASREGSVDMNGARRSLARQVGKVGRELAWTRARHVPYDYPVGYFSCEAAASPVIAQSIFFALAVVLEDETRPIDERILAAESLGDWGYPGEVSLTHALPNTWSTPLLRGIIEPRLVGSTSRECLIALQEKCIENPSGSSAAVESILALGEFDGIPARALNAWLLERVTQSEDGSRRGVALGRLTRSSKGRELALKVAQAPTTEPEVRQLIETMIIGRLLAREQTRRLDDISPTVWAWYALQVTDGVVL